MSFPYLFEDDFEAGNLADSGWDSETDAGNKLDFVHYSTLNATDYPTAAPYRGAYCARIAQTGTDSAILAAGIIDIAAGVRRYFRFYLWFSPDFTASADDVMHIFTGYAGAIPEFVFGFRIVAATNVINFGIGETAPTSFSSESIERGVYYCIELDVTLDDGAGNNGTIDLYVTKEGEAHSESVSATQVASLDQDTITAGNFGLSLPLATTTGTILLDQFAFDDTRIFPITDRHNQNVVLTKSGHVFVGRGVIDSISLFPGAATDCVLQIYDSDDAETHDQYNMVAELKGVVASEMVNLPNKIEVKNGAYVVLTGTEPRAIIKVKCTEQGGGDIRLCKDSDYE